LNLKDIIEKLYAEHNADREELLFLLDNLDEKNKELLIKRANETRLKYYKDSVYLRGLIEFTNVCSRHCLYCGIRAENKNADRYRLTKEQIISCADIGEKLGYKTFVLQGGEDPYFTDEIMVDIISTIKKNHPDCAITISIGERSYESYEKMFLAGADRYLIRHETASRKLYEKLHPAASFDNRRKCLYDLRKIGYQIGSGFMIGLPGQTNKDLVEDLIFVKELNPEMCGIGPFIPQKDTPLRDEKGGTLEDTITLLAVLRLLLPDCLLPATTSLGTINPLGREMGLKAGANVVMPNLSPSNVREKYALYDGKICTGDEAAECRGCIERRINSAGYQVEIGRGDNIAFLRNYK
jgi:biotin synthase